MLVGLRVSQRRQHPGVDLVASLFYGCFGHGLGNDEIGVQRQVRAVLFYCAKWLHNDGSISETSFYVGGAEICQMSYSNAHWLGHAITLAVQPE
jgi:hypothetical protein